MWKSDDMKYNFHFIYAVYKAILQKNSQIFIITKSKEDARQTIHF